MPGRYPEDPVVTLVLLVLAAIVLAAMNGMI